MPQIEQKKCIVCGHSFVPLMSSQKVCSDKCRIEKNRQVKRLYEIRNRKKRNEYKRNSRKSEHSHSYCLFCGNELKTHHKHQKFCNYLCRQRMYRYKKDGRTVPSSMDVDKRAKILEEIAIHSKENVIQEVKTKENDKPCKNNWKREVERIMNLPYDERYVFSKKWSKEENKYAKEIEMKRIREEDFWYTY